MRLFFRFKKGSKDFLDTQATTECRFHLKRVCDMIRTQCIPEPVKHL